MKSQYSVLVSRTLLDTLPVLHDALCAFAPVSLEDWMQSMHTVVGENATSSPALAGVEYVACFVKSDEAEGASTRYAQKTGIPVFQIDCSGKIDPLSLAVDHIFRSLSEMLDASRRHAAQEMMSSGRLRREYEDLQRHFTRLEHFVYSLGGPQISLAEEHSPSDTTLRLGQKHRHCVTQALSTTISGLVYIEIYVHCIYTTENTGFVELELRDTMGTALRTVPVRISNLTHGWNRFMFGDAIDCSDREGTISLRLRDAMPDSFVDLKLGKPTALPELCLITPDGTTGNAPLAFKSWRGIAGCRVPGTDQSISGRKVQFCRPSQLPFPCMLRSTDTKMNFTPVQFWAKEDAVLVHPPARGITIGSIERIAVTNLRRVRAIVHNAHREAPLLRFGLKVMPSGSSLATRTDLKSGEGSSFIWTTLPATSFGELTYECDRTQSGEVDLILAAMVADGESNNMAWALFRGFNLYLDGR